MPTVHEIYDLIDQMAPFETQMSFDNAGFLVGHGEAPVTKILVALDITQAVIQEAKELGAELIVSHHPIIFHPVKSITDQDPVGRRLLALAECGIAAICAHTNLDAVKGGVNDCLAQAAGLTELDQLCQDGVDRNGNPYGIGRVGVLQAGGEPDLVTYAGMVKKALGANGVRYVDAGRPVHKVAVGGGACADMVTDALAKGCDTFVTSDVKYDGFLNARALGINLIDAGHYPTENVVVPALADYLRAKLPGVEVGQSARHHEVFSYL
jgi:dinuclear metal center YbgI/SA1388 family protein